MRTRSQSYRGVASMAAKVGSGIKRASAATGEAVSAASLRLCMMEAKRTYAEALKEYPDGGRGFCAYDRYYAFAAALSSLIYYQVLALAIMPSYRIGARVAELLHSWLRPAYVIALQAAGMCVGGARDLLKDDGTYTSKVSGAAKSTACSALVAAIALVLDTHIGKAVTAVAKAATTVTVRSATAIASAIKATHWSKLRPVYLAHLLRTELKKKDQALFLTPAVPAAANIERDMRALGQPPAPLLLTYKEPARRRSKRTKKS
jgi:hypothetical protein